MTLYNQNFGGFFGFQQITQAILRTKPIYKNIQ